VWGGAKTFWCDEDDDDDDDDDDVDLYYNSRLYKIL